MIDKILNHPFFDDDYCDGNENDCHEFEDDAAISIVRGKNRFCFYNGQGKGMLTEKDIPKFKKLVDENFSSTKR